MRGSWHFDCYVGGMIDDADLPTLVMVRPAFQPDVMELPTNVITLSPEFMSRVRGIAPRRRVPKALLALVVSAALFAVPGVRATCGAGAHHVAQAVGSHVVLSR